MAKINFVSILLFAENALPNVIENNIKNILQQTFQNREIIVIYNENRKDLDSIITQYSVENCRFVEANITADFLNKIHAELQGDLIFYKTCNLYEWYPRHIHAHIEQYELNKKINWVQSLVEIRDLINPNPTLNIMDWRLEKPSIQEFEIDEISVNRNITLDWKTLFVENGISKVNLIKALGNGELAKEITVIKFVNSTDSMKQEIAKQLGQPIEPTEPLKSNYFPTILGNSKFYKRNEEILNEIKKVPTNQIQSIIIKRLVGMGDVLLTEPIRRYLKNIYPLAKITLMCANDRGVSELARYLGYDEIIVLENDQELTQDALMKEIKTEELIEKEEGILDVGEKIIYSYKDYQIKIDLDMAYESRPGMPYLMSYFNVLGVDSEQLKIEDKLYHVYYKPKNTLNKLSKGIIFYRNGSGWLGRTWEDKKYDWIKSKLETDGYQITEINEILKIEDLFDLLMSHSYYFGPDTGIMHICLSLGLETFVISGASLPEVAAYPYTQINKVIAIHADETSLPCLGCKHRMFFEMLQNGQITFVPHCINPNGSVCMTGIPPEEVYNILQINLKNK